MHSQRVVLNFTMWELLPSVVIYNQMKNWRYISRCHCFVLLLGCSRLQRLPLPCCTLFIYYYTINKHLSHYSYLQLISQIAPLQIALLQERHNENVSLVAWVQCSSQNQTVIGGFSKGFFKQLCTKTLQGLPNIFRERSQSAQNNKKFQL